MFFHHFHHFVQHGNPVSFLKDILPILISSVALVVSVITPYLLIRYEKIYAMNKEHKEFMRQIEIYLLEWLNVTSENSKLNVEFLNTLNTPGAVFAKTFQFYDFPALDIFKSYNMDLVNEFYVQMRKLKGFNHHLQMIDKEYAAFKDTIMSGNGQLATNAITFFQGALTDINKEYAKADKEMTDLRIIIRLLLQQTKNVDALQPNKFFSFGAQGRFWYKKDIEFTPQEITDEKAELQREKDKARRDEEVEA